jgi:hypothetical protein
MSLHIPIWNNVANIWAQSALLIIVGAYMTIAAATLASIFPPSLFPH